MLGPTPPLPSGGVGELKACIRLAGVGRDGCRSSVRTRVTEVLLLLPHLEGNRVVGAPEREYECTGTIAGGRDPHHLRATGVHQTGVEGETIAAVVMENVT
jgi:hypothetical protein